MATQQYEFHPIANKYPMMSQEDLADLADDIALHGQQLPCWLFEGKILAGRNRYLACGLIKQECWFKNYVGTDPEAFAKSENLYRSHYTAEQKRELILKLRAPGPDGQPQNSIRQTAEAARVGVATVKRVEEEAALPGTTARERDEILRPKAEEPANYFKDAETTQPAILDGEPVTVAVSEEPPLPTVDSDTPIQSGIGKDFFGQPVPDHLTGIFAAGNSLRAKARQQLQYAKSLRELASTIQGQEGDVINIIATGTEGLADSLTDQCAPYALCPRCAGNLGGECAATEGDRFGFCAGSGWFTKRDYGALSEPDKAHCERFKRKKKANNQEPVDDEVPA